MKVIMYLSTSPKKKCRKLGAQGTLGRQSHSRFEALFVPKERILKEDLKVSLRMGMKRFIYNMENNSAKKPFNIRVSIESPSIPAETQDLRGIGIMDSTLNASP